MHCESKKHQLYYERIISLVFFDSQCSEVSTLTCDVDGTVKTGLGLVPDFILAVQN